MEKMKKKRAKTASRFLRVHVNRDLPLQGNYQYGVWSMEYGVWSPRGGLHWVNHVILYISRQGNFVKTLRGFFDFW